jgi:hypothetical protein
LTGSGSSGVVSGRGIFFVTGSGGCGTALGGGGGGRRNWTFIDCACGASTRTGFGPQFGIFATRMTP